MPLEVETRPGAPRRRAFLPGPFPVVMRPFFIQEDRLDPLGMLEDLGDLVRAHGCVRQHPCRKCPGSGGLDVFHVGDDSEERDQRHVFIGPHAAALRYGRNWSLLVERCGPWYTSATTSIHRDDCEGELLADINASTSRR